MSSNLLPQQLPSNSNDPNTATRDIQGSRTLATLLAQHGTREALSSRGSMSTGDSREQRSNSQHHRPKDFPNGQDVSSHGHATLTHQHPSHATQSLPPPPPQRPPQRHPSLSLDTRNLSNSFTSPFPTKYDSPGSSSGSEPLSPLRTDLTSLKGSLESLWSFSSHKLHVLHHTLTTQDDALRSLTASHARLESSAAHQKHDLEQLRAKYAHAIRESQDADEARKRALREREMLGVANARLWEDKARLEGEKRELRVMLDTEATMARMCEQEVEKVRRPQPVGGVKVKMEEGEEDEYNEDVVLPMKEVKRMVEERLKVQADQYTSEAKELYANLARTQTRVTELEAQLKGYSTAAATVATFPPTHSRVTPPTLTPPHYSAVNGAGNGHGSVPGSGTNRTNAKAAGRSNGHSNPSTGGPRRTPPVSPVTPYTGHPSAASETGQELERKYPFVNGWGGSRGTGRDERRVTSAGHMESERSGTEQAGPRRRVSAPIPLTHPNTLRASPGPIVDEQRLARMPDSPSLLEQKDERGLVRDAQGQVVSAYRGVGSGWKPASLAHTVADKSHSRTHSQQPRPIPSHSRPPTPSDRPSKRARTVEQEGTNHEEGDTERDVAMAVQIQGGQMRQSPPLPPAPQHPPPQLQPPLPLSENEGQTSARDMTLDEQITLVSLSSVLTKKRDGDGWKCVLCRQGKKSPTATFGESTPIGVVTHHVKETHVQFWKELKDGSGKTQSPVQARAVS